jgi:STELLO glycosyltransferases
MSESLENYAVVITSVAGSDHPLLRSYAKACSERGISFVVVGDQDSPADFSIDGCDFWGLDRQKSCGFELGKIAPSRRYSRKNIGYLAAIQNGCEALIETDDDNIPEEEFWRPRQRVVNAAALFDSDWVNVYSYFSESGLWPRGYPLDFVLKGATPLSGAVEGRHHCPIQQGLVDQNPDLDAIFRLTRTLPQNFKKAGPIALGENSWCPFNSQNTTWFKEAFPLLYLPSHCSFRMTDIWRSFVAQRISWLNGWSTLFHGPDMRQERNQHLLLRDFEEEIPGYLNTGRVRSALEEISLRPGLGAIPENLLKCYRKLIELNLVHSDELNLVEAWLADLSKIESAIL